MTPQKFMFYEVVGLTIGRFVSGFSVTTGILAALHVWGWLS